MNTRLILLITFMSGLYGLEDTKTIRPTINPRPVGINNGCCDDQQDYSLLYERLNAISNQIQTDYNLLDQDLNNILNQIDNITPQPSYCNYIPIFGPMTITTSGAYCLNNSVQGTITIAVNDVLLDLNSYSVGGADSTTPINNGVVVNQNLSNITVRNGVIGLTAQQGLIINQNCGNIFVKDIFFERTSSDGIQVNANTYNIVLKNLTLYGCAPSSYNISFRGGGFPSRNCFIDTVKVIGLGNNISGNGIYCNNIDSIVINNISIANIINQDANGFFGIVVQSGPFQNSSGQVIIANCSIQSCIASEGPAKGISISEVNNIYVDNCNVQYLYGRFTEGYNIFGASNVLIKNSSAYQVIDNNSIFTGDGATGFSAQNCTDLIIKNPTVESVSSANGYAYGMRIVGCPRTLIDKAICTNVQSLNSTNYGPNYAQAPRSFGIEINQSSYSAIQHSYCTNIITGGIAAFGFHIDNCPFSTLHECHADTLKASQASWAFRVFEGSNNVLLDQCTSLNLTVTSAPYLANLLEGAVGFEIDTVQNTYMKDCASSINSALSAGARAAGLTVSSPDYTYNLMVDTFYTSSSMAVNPAMGNGIQLSSYSSNCTLKNCISKDNSGNGIVIYAPKTVVYNSQFSNSDIGIANYSTSATIHDDVMTNCRIGLYNNVPGSIIYNCSATQNTTNYSANVPNVVTLGGVPTAGNNLSN